jgi:hypothetical protein
VVYRTGYRRWNVGTDTSTIPGGGSRQGQRPCGLRFINPNFSQTNPAEKSAGLFGVSYKFTSLEMNL